MFDQLLASPGVREVRTDGGAIGIMALHGGLEEGTFEIAEEVAAATGSSLYAVVQPDDLRWHVPSIRFDPEQSPALGQHLADTELAISIHGFGRVQLSRTVLVGGSNSDAGALVATALAAYDGVVAITDRDQIPRPLRGMHPKNPVNLPPLGGVQLELTTDLRATAARGALAAALIDAIADLQIAILQ